MTVSGCEKKYDTVVGSWFNSGFHGHYRSLPRNYYNTFREISKPSPPRKFSARTQEGPFSHPFTKHDNKKTFTNDIDQLAQGGVKKDPSRSSGKFNKGFITWEKKHDPGLYQSCYKRDSRSAPLDFHINDCMKDWAPLGNRMEFHTIYREHFCRQTPVHHEIRAPEPAKVAADNKSPASHVVMRTGRKKRPHTTASEPPLGTRAKQKLMEMRPEWMGNHFLKQRNQSDFSLANEYHGYSSGWESPASLIPVSRRSSVSGVGSRPTSGRCRDMATNTPGEVATANMANSMDTPLTHVTSTPALGQLAREGEQGANTLDMA